MITKTKMARRIIKFRDPSKPHWGANALLVIAAFTSAVFVFALAFILIKFTGWTQPRPVYEGGPLRGVALEEVLYKPQVTEETDAVIKIHSGGSTHARRGEKDVTCLEFSVTSRTGGRLSELVFSLDGYARPYDVDGLQLYMDEKFMAEKPMFQGQSIFDGLNINFNAGETKEFRVTGRISEQAYPSDRIQVGILSADDIIMKGSLGKTQSTGGDFPMWGGYVSVVGDPLE